MEFLSIIALALFLALICKSILSFLTRYVQLRKDYREISFLPFSSIPFVGNLRQINTRSDLFFRLLLRMSKECQRKDKGIFCLWYALWPVTFICSAKGLEVHPFFNNSKQLVKSFDYKLFESWLQTGLITR